MMRRQKRQNGNSPARPERGGAARRVRSADVAWVAERLSARDWQVIEVTNRLRLVSGRQLERLCFDGLSARAREVVRGRVLHRLVRWQVLSVLPRRIGGAARGSAGSVFALGPIGARLCMEQQAVTGAQSRVRRAEWPTDRTARHALVVSELYADLVEQASTHGAQVISFEAEPASWWPDGLGGFVKPDAYAALALGSIREHWWIEVDLATESLPTIRRKLSAYLDFVARGQFGPHEVVPRVVVGAITPGRCMALCSTAGSLPAPAADLFLVLPLSAAADTLLSSLHE